MPPPLRPGVPVQVHKVGAAVADDQSLDAGEPDWDRHQSTATDICSLELGSPLEKRAIRTR